MAKLSIRQKQKNERTALRVLREKRKLLDESNKEVQKLLIEKREYLSMAETVARIHATQFVIFEAIANLDDLLRTDSTLREKRLELFRGRL